VIRCLLKRSEPVMVIGQPVRWRHCPSSLHSALGHLVQAATERIIGAAIRSSMACPVKRGFGDTAAHVLEYRSRCVTIAGRSQRARSADRCGFGLASLIRDCLAERVYLCAMSWRAADRQLSGGSRQGIGLRMRYLLDIDQVGVGHVVGCGGRP